MNLSVRILLLSLLCTFLQKKLQALQTSVSPSLNNEDDEGGDIEENKKKAYVVARVYPSEYLHLQNNKDEPDDSIFMAENDGPAAILDILNQIDNNDDDGDDDGDGSQSKDQNQIHLQTTLATRSTKDNPDTTLNTTPTTTTTTTTTDISTAQKEDILIPITPSEVTEQRSSPDDDDNASNERNIKCSCNEKGIIFYQKFLLFYGHSALVYILHTVR